MPLPGGATDKIGNRYEGLWTIDCLIDLIDEKATEIRLEPPGEEGEGVEFWLQRGDIREYHQVKRQKSKGEWTIKSLEDKDIHVLSNFKSKLNESSSHCVFVSINSASELRELLDRARDSQSCLEFTKNFLSQEWRKSFSELCSKWSGKENKIIEETIRDFQQPKKLSDEQKQILKIVGESYEKLKRVYIKTIDEDSLYQKVEVRLRSLIEKKSNDFPSYEDWKTAVSILAEFALENIHKNLTARNIWNRLDERGYQTRNYSQNDLILTAIDKANQLYLSPLEKQTAIAGQSIPREEVQEAFKSLLNYKNKKGVLLVGEAGVGKSGVMFQIAKELESKNISFFAFRIDNLHEQHLFKRAQVRQILHFQRAINFNQYLKDIEELLNREDIRFHLKQLVITLLSSLENPTEEEWEVIHPFIKDNESTLFNHAWEILSQPQWFMLAKNLGIIEQWLRDDNDLIIDNTVRLISWIAKDLPDEIPPLIEPFIEDQSEKWLNRFLRLAGRIYLRLESSRKLFDLFLTLLDNGKLENFVKMF
jgi:hypothetical protein